MHFTYLITLRSFWKAIPKQGKNHRKLKAYRILTTQLDTTFVATKLARYTPFKSL